MSRISQAKQKLRFADYLLSKNDEQMNQSAVRNIFDAANLAAREFVNNENVTPALLRNKMNYNSPEEKAFSDNFLLLWKLVSAEQDKDTITKAGKSFCKICRGKSSKLRNIKYD